VLELPNKRLLLLLFEKVSKTILQRLSIKATWSEEAPL